MRVRFYIGGYPGPFYNVESDGPALAYTATEYGTTAERRIAPTAQQWAKFGQAIEAAGVWRWAADYPDPGVCDGTQWELELSDGSRELRTGGSNNTPKRFGAFVKALRKLLGGVALE